MSKANHISSFGMGVAVAGVTSGTVSAVTGLVSAFAASAATYANSAVFGTTSAIVAVGGVVVSSTCAVLTDSVRTDNKFKPKTAGAGFLAGLAGIFVVAVNNLPDVDKQASTQNTKIEVRGNRAQLAQLDSYFE